MHVHTLHHTKFPTLQHVHGLYTLTSGFNAILSLYIYIYIFPIIGCRGPKGHETSRIPHFLDNWLTHGGEVVSPTRWPRFIFSHTYKFCVGKWGSTVFQNMHHRTRQLGVNEQTEPEVKHCRFVFRMCFVQISERTLAILKIIFVILLSCSRQITG
jgi:hypothetical protein